MRYGDRGQSKLDLKSGELEGGQAKEKPIFADFVEPVTAAGEGVHAKNLYNDYVYFWRWALWRMFEKQSSGGIISFITASSYVAGPGFIGVREVMRRTFDALWIIDLGGDNFGTRKTPNVFAIKTPVCIALGVRSGVPNPGNPAEVRYAKIEGDTREEKLSKLAAIGQLSDLQWNECPSDWHAPFLPAGQGDYFDWPSLSQLLPWRHSGAQFKRSWPISEDEQVLKDRWTKLREASPAKRKDLFSEASDKTIAFKPKDTRIPINKIDDTTPPPPIVRYLFRSFDRQYCLYDDRVGTYIKPVLSDTHSEKQLFLATLFSDAMGSGPAVTVAATVPDIHYFCGRGGRDVLPLYRDVEATEPNITKGLLDLLSATYGFDVSPEDLVGYVYALLAGQSYSQRFWNELATPEPRVPITKDVGLFKTACAMGQRLLWLQTYAAKMQSGTRGDHIPNGMAKSLTPITSYPQDFEYDSNTEEIRVGSGSFGPVSQQVWDFEVSGLKVVQSWLAYRMKKRFGKKSSALDEVRPDQWRPKMTDEFLEMLWMLEATLDLEPSLNSSLDVVIKSKCFTADELPRPSKQERLAPGEADPGDLVALMGG